jgi:hypothetical protein
MNYRIAARLAEFLAENPSEHITIKDAARSINEEYMSLSRTVREMLKLGLISIKKVGACKFISVNRKPEVLGLITLAKSMKLKDADSLIKTSKRLYGAIG